MRQNGHHVTSEVSPGRPVPPATTWHRSGPATIAEVPSPDVRTRFAFLAETSRLLASSLDLQLTLSTAASVALPMPGIA